MMFLLPPRARSLLLLSPGAKKVTDPHVEPVGNQVGDTQNDKDTSGKSGHPSPDSAFSRQGWCN